MYVRLADAIADCVAYGLLGSGRLPAERELAAYLGLSRGTVVSAYDALRARGLAQSQRGSGTYLNVARPGTSNHEAPFLSKLMDTEQAPLDLTHAALHTPEILPEITVALHDARTLMPRHGFAPLGMPALRSAVADHLTAHLAGPTDAEQVMITQGGQGAISLIATTLVRPGDRVLVEAPTYPGAIEIFSRAGARIEAIERDHAGPERDALERALRTGPARLLYLIPSCHNPTGTTMSEARRREILRLAEERELLVVEDTAMARLCREPPPPDLCALTHTTPVISIGSISKVYWGGLRVGWIRAAPETIQRLGRIRAAADLGAPLLDQAGALAIVSDFERMTGPTRAAAAERVDLLCRELRRQLPDWRFADPRGGWSVWIALPSGDAERFAQIALRHGVAIATGGATTADDRFAGHIRLSAGSAPQDIVQGVEFLRLAWEQLQAQPARAREAIALPV